MKISDFQKANTEDFGRYVVNPKTDIPATELVPDCCSHLVYTKAANLSFLTMRAGAQFELHSHPEEQLMIVVAGECHEIIDGKLYHVKPGDVIHLPAGVVHGAFIPPEADCQAIDVFLPARGDYLQKYKAQHSSAPVIFEDLEERRTT